ncbi:MAG: tetratricopeptide repeat protein [Deltaproteobacteria bacterium]|nr:tetratricopeptide repeat protein [Deltaproteobacteria bacterium]
MKKVLIIHPFLFGAYPVLFLFSHNIRELSMSAIVSPIATIVFCVAVLWSATYLLLRNGYKSALVITFFIVLFFTYGHLSESMPGLYIIWPVLFIIGIINIYKTKWTLYNLTRIINFFGIIMLIFPLYSIMTYKIKGYYHKENYIESVFSADRFEIPQGKRDLPSIYFIILDAYAGSDILREIYGYDNSEFVSFLENRGFFVARKSFSNYNKTFLTVASCLNLNYINNFIGKQLPENPFEKSQFWGLIRESKVASFLKNKGYSMVAFSSGVTDTEIENADICLEPEGNLTEFQHAIINMTPIALLLNIFNSYNQFDLHRKRLYFILNKIPSFSDYNKPVFVFAHILAPHPPFVFGANGEEIDSEARFTDHDGDWLIRKGRLSRSDYIKGYKDQLIYINKLISKTIDRVLSGSQNPPIIILFGDHGPRSMTVFGDPDKTYMRECMSTLNAYHLPDCSNCELNDKSVSPVNIFRIIFNQYFGTNYEVLTNEHWFHYDPPGGFRFVDVKDRLAKPNPVAVHFHFGNDLLNQGKVHEAEQQFYEAFSLQPNDVILNLRLGQIKFKQAQYEKALFHFKQALSFLPESNTIRYNVAVTYYRLEDYEDAIIQFKQVIKTKYKEIESYFFLGVIHERLKQYEKSLVYFQKCIELKPGFSEAHYHIARIYLALGDNDSANKHLKMRKVNN